VLQECVTLSGLLWLPALHPDGGGMWSLYRELQEVATATSAQLGTWFLLLLRDAAAQAAVAILCPPEPWMAAHRERVTAPPVAASSEVLQYRWLATIGV
jgi:hypothetical protein